MNEKAKTTPQASGTETQAAPAEKAAECGAAGSHGTPRCDVESETIQTKGLFTPTHTHPPGLKIFDRHASPVWDWFWKKAAERKARLATTDHRING